MANPYEIARGKVPMPTFGFGQSAPTQSIQPQWAPLYDGFIMSGSAENPKQAEAPPDPWATLQTMTKTPVTDASTIYQGIKGGKGFMGKLGGGLTGLLQYLNTSEGRGWMAGMQGNPDMAAAYLGQSKEIAGKEAGAQTQAREAGLAMAGKQIEKQMEEYKQGQENVRKMAEIQQKRDEAAGKVGKPTLIDAIMGLGGKLGVDPEQLGKERAKQMSEDEKAISDSNISMDTINSAAQSALQNIDKIISGPFGEAEKTIARVMEAGGSKKAETKLRESEKATALLENQALLNLKSIFPGAISDSERETLRRVFGTQTGLTKGQRAGMLEGLIQTRKDKALAAVNEYERKWGKTPASQSAPQVAPQAQKIEFATPQEVEAAFNAGQIKIGDTVTIGGKQYTVKP